MDFEEKAQVGELLAHAGPEVATVIGENEPAPVFNPEQETPVGPLPSIQPEMDKPDHSALSAWVDDLGDFEEAHAGNEELFSAAEKMRAALAEDLTSQDLAKMHEEVRDDDEQYGFVGNFLVDSAIEAAATGVKPEEKEEQDEIDAIRAKNPYLDENDDDGAGGGGGGGGKPGEGEGDDEDDDDADDKPDEKKKAAAKEKKDAAAKKDDKGKPDGGKPAPAPAPSKPDKK